MISKEELEYLAQISKINLNENESRKFPKQLDKTIEYIDKNRFNVCFDNLKIMVGNC